MGTQFTTVYNCFLGKITDDMYLELTPLDTLKDLQNLLLDAIPGFEFPRINLYDYSVLPLTQLESFEEEDESIIKLDGFAITDKSTFNTELTQEEINILALLMKQGWVQRQTTSIENTRMKYSGNDFKMTSQANHLSKLLSLLEESRRDSFHMQRLYKRRKTGEDGRYYSNWSAINKQSAID